jgi:tetratricopeptide (TPR) repeat protein
MCILSQIMNRNYSHFLSLLIASLGIIFGLMACDDPRSAILKDLNRSQFREYLEYKSKINQEVDSLFSRLVQLEDRRDINRLSNRINTIWMQSGIHQINTMMKIGVEAMEVEKYDIAIQAFNEVISAMPDFAEVWNKRANVWYTLEEYQKALKDFDRVLSIEKRHFGALSGKANVFIKLREYEKARDALLELKSIFPNFPEINQRIDDINQRIGIKFA